MLHPTCICFPLFVDKIAKLKSSKHLTVYIGLDPNIGLVHADRNHHQPPTPTQAITCQRTVNVNASVCRPHAGGWTGCAYLDCCHRTALQGYLPAAGCFQMADQDVCRAAQPYVRVVKQSVGPRSYHNNAIAVATQHNIGNIQVWPCSVHGLKKRSPRNVFGTASQCKRQYRQAVARARCRAAVVASSRKQSQAVMPARP